jgi:hypothetical protein
MKPLILLVGTVVALVLTFTVEDLYQAAFCLLAGSVAFCEAVNDVRHALRRWA